MSDIFSPAALEKAVVETLNVTVPNDKKGAVVIVANTERAQLVAVARMGDGWSIEAVMDYPWGGHVSAGVTVKGTW